MADANNDTSAEVTTQSDIAAAESGAAAVAANGDTKQQDGGDDHDNNEQEFISLGKDNETKSTKPSHKQRKAARWKQMNKQKRDNKRQKFEKSGEEGDEKLNKKFKATRWKRDYDDRSAVDPHKGSFANENMQKLFGVDVDAPPPPPKEGEKGEDPATTANKDTGDIAPANAKVPKRKLALLVSFIGKNYAGFQINDEKRTLQAELELALHRAGIISKMNFGHPSKYGWSNSARTDKGVHAAAQVCSLKGEMIFHNTMDESPPKPQLDAMRERVNEFLPEDIRVLDFERVTRMFCARTSRDKVRYQYMVPSYMLCSQEETREAFSAVEEGDAKATDGAVDLTPLETAILTDEKMKSGALERARDALLRHRVTDERMERLRSGLELFEGTHSFHNYTRRVGADKASATRYILSFGALDPVLVPGGTNDDGSKRPDAQWIPLQVVGQSFLLNQIRKMVSAAVDLARGAATEEQIRQSFSKTCRMKVNVAPAQGLFLDRSYFELYNKHKVKNAVMHGDKTPDRNELEWVEVEGEEMPAAARRIEEFKNETIIPHIIQEETNEGNFLKYLYAHDVLCKYQNYTLMDDVVKSKGNENGSAGGAGKC